jgi:hypothetical protein
MVMSINAVGSSLAALVQRTSSGGAPTQTSSIVSAAQEASETPTQTAREAQQGDPIAKKKLAALQAKQQASQPKQTPASTESGKTAAVDLHA